eukprot:6158338-Pleurochrysis_carterae.AAC.1
MQARRLMLCTHQRACTALAGACTALADTPSQMSTECMRIVPLGAWERGFSGVLKPSCGRADRYAIYFCLLFFLSRCGVAPCATKARKRIELALTSH